MGTGELSVQTDEMLGIGVGRGLSSNEVVGLAEVHMLACEAGVQRGGRGKDKIEREALSRSNLTSPSLPFVSRPHRLYTCMTLL